MSDKTIAMITTGRGDSMTDAFWSRLQDALVQAGCKVEVVAVSEAKRVFDLLESGAVPVIGRGGK